MPPAYGGLVRGRGRALLDVGRCRLVRDIVLMPRLGADAKLFVMPQIGAIHHLVLWVEDLEVAGREWGWLLGRLGYTGPDPAPNGQSWTRGEMYVFLEAGPARVQGRHDRMRAGLNHVAFHAGSREEVEALAAEAPNHGWTLMFANRHPHAGGRDHIAAYLESSAGFEVELVADRT